MDELTTDEIKLVKWATKRLRATYNWVDHDDIHQVCLMAMVKTRRHRDPNGGKLSSYYWLVASRDAHDAFFEEPRADKHAARTNVSNRQAYNAESEDTEDAADTVARLLAQLPPADAELIRQHWLENKTLKELGAPWGCHEHTLWFRIQKILKRLQFLARKQGHTH